MNAQKKMANGNGVAEELISDGCLTVEVRGSKRIAFFETLTRPGIREPRENRGRLRHCNGLQTPKATGRAGGFGKAGARSQAPSQDTGLAVLVMVVNTRQRTVRLRKVRRQLLRQREG